MAEIEDPRDEEDEDEDGTDDGDDGGEGEDAKPASLVETWEADSGLFFELHATKEQDELLIIEEDESEDGEPEEHSVCFATNLAELDEAIEMLKKIRPKFVEAAAKRKRK